MPSERLLPVRLELDLADQYLTGDCARMIKNLSFFRTDTSEVTSGKSGASGMYRPLQSNQVYYLNFKLPAGYNHAAGAYSSKDTNSVFVLYYNDNGNHGLYRINGNTQTIDTIYLKSCLNVKLSPEFFMHVGGAWLQTFDYTDPNTNLPRRRSYFNYTDGFNDLRFICIEDSLSTNGFDSSRFPYFVNPEPECLLINAGEPTPLGCVRIAEVPNTEQTKPNFLKFKTWQFRIRYYDVYGRMSEYGIISDLYIPGVNDCIGNSEGLARCLDLTFPAGNALINTIEVAFRNCNDESWEADNTLFLYTGSNFGDWWLRSRNPKINYNAPTNEITYRFCKDKECNPIDVALTNRTQNPLPRTTQSVAKIGNVLGVGNNKSGFNPFGSDLMSNISVRVDPPNITNSPVRNIEIFVPIYNPFTNTQQPVYKDGNGDWVWGGRYSASNNYVSGVKTDYQQYFGDDRNGFIGYLAGTGLPPNSTVSELYYVDDSNVMVKVEDYSIVNVFPFTRKWFLRFSFSSVAPATYVFRISSSLAKLTDTTYQNTSTYVWGLFGWANKTVNFSNLVNINKELIVDVCDGDYSSLNDTMVLAIYDLTSPNRPRQPQAFSGYVDEKNVDAVPEIPVELLKVDISHTANKTFFVSANTDHNGFYFGTVEYEEIIVIDPHFDVNIYGNCGCNDFKTLISYQLQNDHNLHAENFVIEGRTECPDYGDSPCNRIIISGKVTLCNSDTGVPGVGVVLTRGQYAITGADGTFTIIAHDNNYQNTTRTDKLYYVPTICAFKGCDSVCIEPFDVVITKCTTCADRLIAADLRQVKFDVIRGPLSGGRYGVGIWGAHDWLGRHTFVQTKDEMYFTVPTLVDTKTFSPSTITLLINPAATFPVGITKITLGITKELSLEDYIEWIVDRVVFIDNSGNENKTAPTQIKIYYASLIEYNKQNNFNTTTGWQFINTAATPAVNYTSDYVEFYVNGDGTFFPKLIRALIKYDQTGQYFLIDYDTALKDLTQYALIRLSRPNECATQGVFFEQCITIDIVNGKAQQNSIQLNFFDTYYKYRQIPIPIPTSDPTVTVNVVKTFGFPFEHNSPSDFWGFHCINIGRVNTTNPYEAEIIKENQIMLSGVISDNGQLNFFNFFDDALAKNFKGDFGGIVSILPQTGVIACVCQADVFKTGYNDNLVRWINDKLQLPSEADLFGEPERKFGLNYGCQLFDKNTIQIKEGLIEFLDTRESALIQYDYSNIYIVSKVDLEKDVVGGVDSYIRSKVKFVNNWNKTHRNNIKYFCSSIDPAARTYLLTDYEIRSNDYVNEERDIAIEKNDTLIFDYKNGIFRGFIAATPQNWTFLESNLLDLQLFALTNENVYYHYSVSANKTYNTFFGVAVEKVIRFVALLDNIKNVPPTIQSRTSVLLDNMKKMQPLTIAVYCVQSKYFAAVVTTESNQVSRILLDYFKQGLYFSEAPFLCDLNTPDDPNYPNLVGVNKLVDGNKLFGSIVDITMVGDPSKNTQYSELTGFIVQVFGIEKSGS